MKRCQLCDLVYEDDQIVCDMDGLELVYDPRELSIPENVEAQAADPPSKSPSRNFAVLSLTVVLLGAMLYSVYYVYTRQTAPESADHSQVTTARRSVPNSILATPAATATHDPAPVTDVKTSVEPAPANSRSQVRKQEGKKSKPQKKESVFSSIFRKTKRVLKKPFKS